MSWKGHGRNRESGLETMDRNRAHGKIDRLPPEIREDVEQKLLEGIPYGDISQDLKDQGYDVHGSSVGRYGRRYLKKFESVRVAQQFARLLAGDNVERPPTEIHEANNMIMNQIIMETLMDEDLDAAGLGKAASAVATLQRAQVQNEKLKMEARREAGAVHTAMNLLKDKVFLEISQSHPDVADVLIRLAEQTEREMEKAP